MAQRQTYEIEGQVYNVDEAFSLYDTIGIVNGFADRSNQPPGWFATFAAFSGGIHSFFNVRNKGNCELAYCNLDTRDQMAYAFIIKSISCAWWGSVYGQYDEGDVVDSRFWLPLPLWQAVVPSHASLTLRVQQDDKLKLNAMMAGAGYGPVGGGYGNLGQPTVATVPQNILGSHWPNMLAQTQGEAVPSAAFPLPNEIAVPRRASISVLLDLSEYCVAGLAALQGPGVVNAWNTGYSDEITVPIMFGVTVRINGNRLVQQRGQLHA